MKHKAFALSLTLLMGVGLSCDSPTRPPTTGSITLTLVSASNGAPMIVSARDSKTASAVAGATANVALDGVRVTVSGPTSKTVTSNSPSGGFFDLTVTDLSPGSYTVTVEGLVGGLVDHFGQTSSVSVSAGNSTAATITFTSFQPIIPASAVVDTSDVLHFTVNYSAVPTATSYIVAWSTSPTMAGAASQTVTGTSANIQVTDEAKYYVTVKAVNAVVTSGGIASPAKTVFVFQGVASVTIAPANQTIAAGATLPLTATGRDADNNVVSSVSWFWSSDDPSVAKVSQAGVVTGISGGQVTITALGKGMPGSTPVTVGAVIGTKLAFSIPPTSAIAGDPLSPAVQVEIQDAAGNRVTTARDAVTIAFANNAGSGTLTGTKVVNAINGIASFSGLWVNKTGAGYTLAATSGSLTGATSTGFTITPAAPAKLAFSQQPTNVQGNLSISPPVTVTIADQFDNAINTATNAVSIFLGANPWKTPFSTGATLTGVSSTPAVGGTATFNSLKIDKPTSGYSLVATAGSLTGATSNNFRVSLAFSQISVGSGGYHTCGRTNGGLYCWGYNGYGELGAGTGSFNTDTIAGLVAGSPALVSVANGYFHTCGLTAGGVAFCWGANFNGQLGNNSTTGGDTPVAVAGGHTFSALAAGYGHTCGITTSNAAVPEDRQVWCWGANGQGQVGDGLAIGTTAQYLTPVRVAVGAMQTQHATSISAGESHTCGIAAGTAYCWGTDGNGQLGDDAPLVAKSTPTVVAGGLVWLSISGGASHTCGIVADNTARCWGYDGNGQLGDGGNVQQPTPVVLANVASITWGGISAGSLHTCAVSSGGSGYCWGYNGDGRLGDDNAPTNTNTRSPVAGSLNFVEIKAGNSHSCGRTAGAVYCWGDNGNGQLGIIGTNNTKKAPTQIVQ